MKTANEALEFLDQEVQSLQEEALCCIDVMAEHVELEEYKEAVRRSIRFKTAQRLRSDLAAAIEANGNAGKTTRRKKTAKAK